MRLVRIFLLVFLSHASAGAASGPVNVLLVTADDMNADSGGWNGNALGLTPNLDAFAKTAYRFVHSHVTVPICQPGRSALMTGRVPHRNGALGFNPIDRGTPTLVEILRENGYYTAVIAKAAHMAPADKFPWHSIGEQALGKQPEEFAAKLRGMITASAEEGKPFFINANICDPHRPFVNGVGNKSNGKKGPDPSLGNVKILKPEEVSVPDFLEDIPKVREEIAQYYSSVSRFDLTFGLILRELAAAGREADTLVLFMSDHGMSFPFSKATVYRNGTWSPVLIRVPGMGSPQTIPELVSSVDIMPSLLDLIHLPRPEGMDGRSLVPLLRGEAQADRDFVITHVNTVSSGKSFAQRCIRTQDRSLMFHTWVGGPNHFRVEAMAGLSFAAMNDSTDPRIRSRVQQLVVGESLMLFDTKNDPSERNNLVRDPHFQEELNRLSGKLLQHMERTGDPQTQAFRETLAKISAQ